VAGERRDRAGLAGGGGPWLASALLARGSTYTTSSPTDCYAWVWTVAESLMVRLGDILGVI